jgi:hypothetical protein
MASRRNLLYRVSIALSGTNIVKVIQPIKL